MKRRHVLENFDSNWSFRCRHSRVADISYIFSLLWSITFSVETGVKMTPSLSYSTPTPKRYSLNKGTTTYIHTSKPDKCGSPLHSTKSSIQGPIFLEATVLYLEGPPFFS